MTDALFIAGWAHPARVLEPLARRLRVGESVFLSAAEAMALERLPEARVVVGHSLGGLLALKGLPEACERLVLLAATARFCTANDYPCGVPEKTLRLMMRQLERAPQAVLERFFRNVRFPEPAPPPPPVREPIEILLAGLETLRRTDLRERLPSLRQPVLLLHGTQDRIIPHAAAKRLLDLLANARLETLPDAGHALFAEPALHRVATAAAAFLRAPA